MRFGHESSILKISILIATAWHVTRLCRTESSFVDVLAHLEPQNVRRQSFLWRHKHSSPQAVYVPPSHWSFWLVRRSSQNNASDIADQHAGKSIYPPARWKLKPMAEGSGNLDKSPIPTGASNWKWSALNVLNAHVFDFEFDNLTIPSDVQKGKQLRFLNI